MSTQRQLTRFLLTLCLVSALPAMGAAQQKLASRSVTLLESDRMPAGKSAVIIRRTSGADFVELAPSATTSQLTVALHILDTMHERGETVKRDMAVAIGQVPEQPKNGHAKLHGVFLQQLRSAKPHAVQGFGNVRSFQIRVPMRNNAK